MASGKAGMVINTIQTCSFQEAVKYSDLDSNLREINIILMLKRKVYT
jgi:hypothetical protein